MTVRSSLEPVALAAAVRLATASQLDAVESCLTAMKRSVKLRHHEQYLATHYRFHFEIYAICAMPIVQEMIEGVWLRCGPTLTLALPKYIPGLKRYESPWMKERATDFLRGDVTVKGGIPTLIKAVHLAEAFHLNYELHHGGNSLDTFTNLHVIMAIANTKFFEVLLPSQSQQYGLIEDIRPDGEGLVHAPNAPGLNAAIDLELI